MIAFCCANFVSSFVNGSKKRAGSASLRGRQRSGSVRSVRRRKKWREEERTEPGTKEWKIGRQERRNERGIDKGRNL